MKTLTFPLLLLVTFNMLPSLYLKPAWSIAFVAVLLAFRFWLELTAAKVPGRKIMAVVLVAAGAATWTHYQSFFGDEAAGTLLMLLNALKVYELKHKRDYFISVLLSFLVLMSFLLLDQSLLLTIFLLVDVALLLTFLFALEEESWSWRLWRRSALPGFGLIVKALPLMVLIFVLFPRFSTGFGQGTDPAGKMGVSESLRPGSVSKLIASDELMFRAEFLDGVMPPRQGLYWRGAILDESHGLNWDRSNGDRRQPPRANDTPTIEVYLEPGNDKLLFSLDNTDNLSLPNDLTRTRVSLRRGHIFELDRPLANRERYFLHNAEQMPRVPGEDPNSFLAVNSPLTSAAEAMIQGLRRETPRDTVKAVLKYFHDGGFTYTLEPEPVASLSEFLLKRKSGFCEHYAGAMGTMLRQLQIPARVVVGFQGGSPSLLDNFISVRSRDAHAWVEYFDESGDHWRRVDPTAEVEPQRITLGSSSYLSAPTTFSLWLSQSRALFDEIDAHWTGFLIRFDLAKQQELLAQFGMEGVLFRALPVFLILAVVLVLAFLYFIEAQRRAPLGEVEALYLRLQNRLKRLAVEKRLAEGPDRLLRRMESEKPALAVQVEPILSELTELRFGHAKLTKARRDNLRRQMRRLH